MIKNRIFSAFAMAALVSFAACEGDDTDIETVPAAEETPAPIVEEPVVEEPMTTDPLAEDTLMVDDGLETEDDLNTDGTL